MCDSRGASPYLFCCFFVVVIKHLYTGLPTRLNMPYACEYNSKALNKCGKINKYNKRQSVGPSGFRDHGKRNPIKSNGICRIGDFLGFFNASTHRPKIYYSLFHPYLTLGSTCGVNVCSVNAQS